MVHGRDAMELSPPDIHVFFFNDPATTEIYTLSLHDALPICLIRVRNIRALNGRFNTSITHAYSIESAIDRKSGSAGMPRPISYAVFCLKKKITAQRSPLP